MARADQLAVLRASDDACGLFSQAQRALLDAAIARTRDDAVLAGADPEQLDRIAGARRALPCADVRLTELAAAHRAASRSGELHRNPLSGSAASGSSTAARAPWGAAALARGAITPPATQPSAWRGLTASLFALAFNSDAPASAVLVARDPAAGLSDRFHRWRFVGCAGPRSAPAPGAPRRARNAALSPGPLAADTAAALAPASGDPARGFHVLTRQPALADPAHPARRRAIELRDRAGDISERSSGLKSARCRLRSPCRPCPW
jgi:hypothetical protein